MKYIRNTIVFIFVVINLFVGVGFLFGAFGRYFSPALSPFLSIAGLGFPFFAVLNLSLLVFWLFIRSKYAWLPIILFLIGSDAMLTYSPIGCTRSSDGGKVLKVLTYNVMGMPVDSDNDKGNKTAILEYIKKSKADIVCLQEVPYYHDEIKRRLQSVYPYFKVVTFHSESKVACLSKTPILSGESIDIVSSGNGSAVFYVKVDKHKIPVIVNHLESNKLNGDDKQLYESLLEDPKNRITQGGKKHLLVKLADAAALRAPQAEVIAKKIKEINSPYVIVCGDFNDTPLSYTRRVIGEGLQDTYRESGFGPARTYHEHYMYFRIDHIFVGQGYRVLDCKVDESISASDHFPYWTKIEI